MPVPCSERPTKQVVQNTGLIRCAYSFQNYHMKNSASFRDEIGIFYALFLLFRQVFLYDKVVYNEVLTLHCVITHVVFQKLLHLIVFVKGDLF